MNADIQARLEKLHEIVDIARTRNVEIRDKAEENIEFLREVTKSLLKLEVYIEQQKVTDYSSTGSPDPTQKGKYEQLSKWFNFQKNRIRLLPCD